MAIYPDPAFPVHDFSNGLDKREYFAAAALQGLLANKNTVINTATRASDVAAKAWMLGCALNKVLLERISQEGPDE